MKTSRTVPAVTTDPIVSEPRQNRNAWNAPNPKPTFAFKGYKSFKGMEGGGYNATLMVDGVAAAEIIEEGCGGSPIVRWARTPAGVEAEKKVQEYLARVEPIMCYGHPSKANIELLLGYLDETRNLEKDCQKKVLFERADGHLLSVKGPFDTSVKARIEKDFPGAIILNELFGQKAVERSPEEIATANRDARVKAGYVMFKSDATGGRWMELKVKQPLTPALRAQLAAKHPTGLVFHNDLVAARSASKTRAA